MLLILALFFTISRYLLQTTLDYPAILLDRASFVRIFVFNGGYGALAGFILLLFSGLLMIASSLHLGASRPQEKRRGIIGMGSMAGICWVVGALLGILLIFLGEGVRTENVAILAMVLLVLVEIGAPCLLMWWTITLARQFHVYRALSVLSALGSMLVFLRSLVWVYNAVLPVDTGSYGLAGWLAILAVLGESLWLIWLFLFGFYLLRRDVIV